MQPSPSYLKTIKLKSTESYNTFSLSKILEQQLVSLLYQKLTLVLIFFFGWIHVVSL